jgi:hypothetical protein
MLYRFRQIEEKKMAKLKATPKNFAEALQAFDNFKRGQRIGTVRLGNNTFLESYVDGCSVDRICVRLHSTNIVVFYPDGRVTLHTGGYKTVTTKERINQFINARLHQDDFEWFVSWFKDGKIERQRLFVEGINIGQGVL